MQDYLAVDTARMRRFNSPDGNPSLSDLVATSQQLTVFAAIESGSETAGTPLEIYHAIARGDLARALQLAKSGSSGAERDERIVLIGASEGATAEMIGAAFEVPVDENMRFDSALLMYGLAVREKRDPAAYVKILASLGSRESEAALRFLAALTHGLEPDQARGALPSIGIRWRLMALNSAVIMLGQRAPRAWREEVTRGLFVGERGYFAK